ncbi:hypothetical protein MTO96_043533, partial [Rhipicephalus appendiculatus]
LYCMKTAAISISNVNGESAAGKKNNRTGCHRRPRYGGRCTNTSFRGIYKGYCDCFLSQGTCVNNRCI